MINKVIVPGELYEKAVSTLPKQWIDMFFDTSDAESSGDLVRTVSIDAATLCNPKNLSMVADDINTAYSNTVMGYIVIAITMVTGLIFGVMSIITGVTVFNLALVILFLIALTAFYFERGFLLTERARYVNQIVTEMCNMVLQANDQAVIKQHEERLNTASVISVKYKSLLNSVKECSPEVYSQHVFDVRHKQL